MKVMQQILIDFVTSASREIDARNQFLKKKIASRAARFKFKIERDLNLKSSAIMYIRLYISFPVCGLYTRNE